MSALLSTALNMGSFIIDSVIPVTFESGTVSMFSDIAMPGNILSSIANIRIIDMNRLFMFVPPKNSLM